MKLFQDVCPDRSLVGGATFKWTLSVTMDGIVLGCVPKAVVGRPIFNWTLLVRIDGVFQDVCPELLWEELYWTRHYFHDKLVARILMIHVETVKQKC